MSRCPRCNSCEPLWNINPCEYCAYPNDDIRTPAQIEIDDAEIEKFYDTTEENI